MSAEFTLRYYQAGAVNAIDASLARHEHPVVSMPTGAGKSATIAALAKRISDRRPTARIVITAPSRELVEQDEAALLRQFDPTAVGVVCASLKRREVDRRILVGTSQSLTGAIDFDPAVVMVDEAHLMPLEEGSLFARLFDALPRKRRTPRAGFSATTFRRADGAIYGPTGWFTEQVYEIKARELIVRGYLSRIRYTSPTLQMTTAGVSTLGGDYNQGQLTAANIDQVTEQTEVILQALETRRRGMVFAVTVDHARAFVEAFTARGVAAELIVGVMKAGARSIAVENFISGNSKVAITVAAALTGFDVPEIDLIASCRPTKSPIIHTQSIGRGARVANGKEDTLVLDFAGNVQRFGPIHSPSFDTTGKIKTGKASIWTPCISCATFNRVEAWRCSHCASALPAKRPREHADLQIARINFAAESRAIESLVARSGPTQNVEVFALHGHEKRKEPGSYSLMLVFDLGGGAILRIWEKDMRSERWRRRWRALEGDDPAPVSFQEAYARREELVRPLAITLKQDGPFWRVVSITHRQAKGIAA